MTSNNTYRINTDRFAHETVDDEVIIIDMDEGNYFSMQNSAAVIWELIASGLSLSAITSALSRASDTSSELVSEQVGTFLTQLINEQILQEQPPESQDATETKLASLEFQAPTFDKYTEMQDLLTLDPIHEVDESGWPNRATASDG